MTGPEKETLALVLRLHEEFRAEVRQGFADTKDDLNEIKNDVKDLAGRVTDVELARATEVGVAAGSAAATAHIEAGNEKRWSGMARLFAIVASAAAVGASVATALHSLGVF